MNKLIFLLCLLSTSVYAQLTVPSTAYTRDVLRSTNDTQARVRLGINSSTNSYLDPLVLANNIAVWGDSLTAGLSLLTGTNALESKTGHSVFWAGVGGEGSSGIYIRLAADTNRYANYSVLWAGANDIPTFAADTTNNITNMVFRLTSPKRFMVLSLLNNTNWFRGTANYGIVTNINAYLAGMYPAHYLDIRSMLVAAFDAGNPQDVVDNANDVPPSSLRADQIHLNTAGYAFVSQAIANFIATNWTFPPPEVIRSLDVPALFASPPSIGTTTPGLGTFTTVNAQKATNIYLTVERFMQRSVTNFLGTWTTSGALGMCLESTNVNSSWFGLDFFNTGLSVQPWARIGVNSTGGSVMQFGLSDNSANGINAIPLTLKYNSTVGIGATTNAINPAYNLHVWSDDGAIGGNNIVASIAKHSLNWGGSTIFKIADPGATDNYVDSGLELEQNSTSFTPFRYGTGYGAANIVSRSGNLNLIVGTNKVMEFSTATVGNSVHIVPTTNIVNDLGSGAFYWRTGYIGTLITTNIPSITAQYLNVQRTTNPAYLNAVNTGGSFYVGKEGSAAGNLLVGDLAYASVISSAGTRPIQIAVNDQIAMTVLAGGLVGIGTTNPVVQFDLVGQGTVNGNLGAIITSGNTNVLNLNLATTTIVVTNAITFAHATNGVASVHKSQVCWFTAGGAGPFTLTLPAWRTNLLSAVPAAITNGVVTKMVVESIGTCANAATQTNCYVSFEYFK